MRTKTNRARGLGAALLVIAAAVFLASGVHAQQAPPPGSAPGAAQQTGPADPNERGGFPSPPVAVDPTVQTEAPDAAATLWPYLLGALILLAAAVYLVARRRRGGQVIAARSGPKAKG